jgi:signal transduction histidine kinase
MELDKRVGEYAAAMVHDAGLLLEDSAALNEEQLRYIGELKRFVDLFLSLYSELSPQIAHLGHDKAIANVVHDFRQPLSNIANYCELLGLIEEVGPLSETQLQLLHQIKVAQNFIHNTFAVWVDRYPL